jgi:hypothetical protein
MNAWKLIARSLAFYWRTHLGVAAGAAVATAVLVGALVVGDSVRHSLQGLALRRLGHVEVAMASFDRFFRAEAQAGADANDLAAAMAAELGAPVAPGLLLDGSARRPDGSARANRVQVVGVDERFWRIGGARDLLAGAEADEAVVNAPLAEQLGIRAPDSSDPNAPKPTIVLRVPVPSGLPKDAPLSGEKEAQALRVSVRAIAADGEFGRFSLRANQLAPLTVFLPLATLQGKLDLAGRGNVLLAAGRAGGARPVTPAEAGAALRKHWRLGDADLHLRRLGAETLELRTGRVFLDPPAGKAAAGADPNALRILTYFVNEVRCGKRTSAYAIVTAMEAARGGSPPSPVPANLAEGEVVLNRWLADDIGAKVGDRIEMTYSTLGPMRSFIERSKAFAVRSIVPIAGAARDPDLMPDFPGLADVKNCRDWKPGIDIDLKKLEDPNDKYQKYWDAHRGTPKAFLTLGDGQAMWGNRFGDLTAVRYRAASGAEDRVARAILQRLDPAAIGLYFLPVREQALAAANPTSDFGGLFLGLSFFLIASAVLLTGLLFVFNVEQRSLQTGTLLALGFRPWRIRRLMLAEGGILAVGGCAVGALGGLAYTRLVLVGLATVWRDAAASAPIRYHAEGTTVLLGAGIGLAVALCAMFAALVLQGRATARELLAAGAQGRASAPAGRRQLAIGLVVAAVCIAGAVVLVVLSAAARRVGMAGAFFGSGGLLLIGSLALAYTVLAALGRGSQAGRLGLTGLGVRTCGRRRWRSLTTAGLLACGVFLVAAVEVFRLDPNKDADKPTSGTGGFALYGESALPILQDLNDPSRRRKLALDGEALDGVRVVQLRVNEGDDASCLNLNRAQRPRLLGVEPQRLAGRFTFVEALGRADGNDPWLLLSRREPDGAVPAIGDDDTLRWALHKELGQTIDLTDERGRKARLKLVGRIGGSIFQGNLLIAEQRFGELFPSTSGYRAFLVDARRGSLGAARAALSSALEDFGLELAPAARRLAQFAEVQNTYLSIFSALGGLGLLLGSVALGVVVLRNVLERRGELALLRAVGFARGQLRWVVLCEHWTLVALGLVCGVVSAAIAVVPALASPDAAVPYASWAATLGGVAVSGLLWTWLAAAVALRGELLAALRNE